MKLGEQFLQQLEQFSLLRRCNMRATVSIIHFFLFFCYQVYPQLKENERPLTQLQTRLMKKLGQHAYPFYFEVRMTNLHYSLQIFPSTQSCLLGLKLGVNAFKLGTPFHHGLHEENWKMTTITIWQLQTRKYVNVKIFGNGGMCCSAISWC